MMLEVEKHGISEVSSGYATALGFCKQRNNITCPWILCEEPHLAAAHLIMLVRTVVISNFLSPEIFIVYCVVSLTSLWLKHTTSHDLTLSYLSHLSSLAVCTLSNHMFHLFTKLLLAQSDILRLIPQISDPIKLLSLSLSPEPASDTISHFCMLTFSLVPMFTVQWYFLYLSSQVDWKHLEKKACELSFVCLQS